MNLSECFFINHLSLNRTQPKSQNAFFFSPENFKLFPSPKFKFTPTSLWDVRPISDSEEDNILNSEFTIIFSEIIFTFSRKKKVLFFFNFCSLFSFCFPSNFHFFLTSYHSFLFSFFFKIFSVLLHSFISFFLSFINYYIHFFLLTSFILSFILSFFFNSFFFYFFLYFIHFFCLSLPIYLFIYLNTTSFFQPHVFLSFPFSTFFSFILSFHISFPFSF